jgi:DNA repair protein RAD50
VICKATEAAISTFHREKMDQVNKYLSEIWREVYHGEDISLIEVQASHVEDTKRRKSYSYSIVMEKAGGRKMEMKGRCSMGQKVLASIVIRLAIAEVFANSARILALDEPTTNLDREHIANLAHQLCRLIELNDGKYMQMIIISHDLDFIRMMEKYTPSYYEVSRDHRNFSVIKRKEIREIYAQQ